jgi:hypothetical protein
MLYGLSLPAWQSFDGADYCAAPVHKGDATRRIGLLIRMIFKCERRIYLALILPAGSPDEIDCAPFGDD